MADHEIPVEIEAKLLVPTATDLRAIGRLTHLGPYPLRSRGAARLHSTYLDTPSLTLARHGVALRLRRQGRQWEATLKWAGQVEGDVHERPELTVALPSAPALPFTPLPRPLHTQLAALVAGQQLTPILTSEIHRRLFDVLPPDPTVPPKPIAELALDRVHLRAPSDGQPETTYCEVEVERRQGERRDIASLARLLRDGFNLAPSSESKFGRGLTLLYGAGIIGSGDQRVLAYDTVREGVRHIVARHLHRLRDAVPPGVRTGPHQTSFSESGCLLLRWLCRLGPEVPHQSARHLLPPYGTRSSCTPCSSGQRGRSGKLRQTGLRHLQRGAFPANRLTTGMGSTTSIDLNLEDR